MFLWILVQLLLPRSQKGRCVLARRHIDERRLVATVSETVTKAAFFVIRAAAAVTATVAADMCRYGVQSQAYVRKHASMVIVLEYAAQHVRARVRVCVLSQH